jgi:hypothetical protein
VLPAGFGEAGDERVRALRAVNRGMDTLVIVCEEYIPVAARRKQRPGENVIEVHFLAALQVARPRSAIAGQQRVEIVYSWGKQFARLIDL